MEKRTHERQAVTLSVEIVDPAIGEVILLTKDLSKGGAFVRLDKEKCPPLGRIVSLRLPGMLWGEKITTVTARVVRVTDAGMALQFIDFEFD